MLDRVDQLISQPQQQQLIDQASILLNNIVDLILSPAGLTLAAIGVVAVVWVMLMMEGIAKIYGPRRKKQYHRHN